MPKERGTYSRGMSSTRSRGNTASYTANEGREDEDDEGSESDEDFEDDEESESDEDAIFNSDFVVEEHIEAYDDELYQPEFKDCLDGGSKKDKIYKNGKIWNEVPYGSIRLEPWLIFSSKEEFMDVLRNFCIQEGFSLTVEKADTTRFTACCVIKGCEWRIHAARLADKVSWAIKTLKGEHLTCGRLEDNPMVSSKWLCKNLSEEIVANQEVPVEALQKVAMEKFRIKVKKRLLYKVKTLAKREIHGGFDDSYGLLPRYAEMIKATNPGSYALVTWTGNTRAVVPKFKACFFAFAANVRGFIGGCRPLIGIDGVHLSGNYKDILLSALGIDGNNEIFLIAYDIVDTESTPSWTYFFRNLKICFEKEGCKRDDWTFISDRMRGVDSAVNEVFPRATRRVCCQHLYMNCKNAGYSGTAFHKLFWTAADAYNVFVFKKSMLKIHEYNPEAVAYLDSCTEQWSRHVFDPLVCCDHNTTKFVESFNACTKAYRDLPVFTLLEAIRNWSMKRIGLRFDKAVDMNVNMLTDYAKKVLQTRSDESRFCYATSCGG